MSWIQPIKSLALEFYIILSIKDPCKDCLIRACCSEKCERAIAVHHLIRPHDSIKEKKAFTLMALGGIVTGVCGIIFTIFKAFM